MNANRGLARLGQPRSNMATNALLAITFVVFALVADTAVDQQRGGGIAGANATPDVMAVGPVDLDLRTLLRRPHF